MPPERATAASKALLSLWDLIQCTAFGFSQTQSLCFSALASISPQGLEHVYTASWVRSLFPKRRSLRRILSFGPFWGQCWRSTNSFRDLEPATAERQNSAILAIHLYIPLLKNYEEPVDDTSSICPYQLVLGEYLFFALETTGFGSRTTSSSLN